MELKREKKKLLSESNLRLLTSLTISLANKVDSTAEKCINPFTPNTPYAKGVYVTHDNYIYESKLACNDADWVESHWVRLSDTIEELTVNDVKSYLSLTQDQLDTLSKIILDSEVRLDKTWSSSRVYSSIQDAIDTSKAFTLAELGKASGASYRVVASTGDMTEQKYIYLMSDGSGSYNMYIVEDNGTVTQIGNTTINLSDYYTKTEVDNDFLKKTDATSTYATITTVDGKVDKTNIATSISNTPSDEKVVSEKAFSDTISDLKTNFSDGVSTIYDAVVSKGVTPADKSPSSIAIGIEQLGTTEPELLWENTGSALTFAAQTLNIDLSKYSHIIISCVYGANEVYSKLPTYSLLEVNGKFRNISAISDNEYAVASRKVTVNETSIVFSSGSRVNMFDKTCSVGENLLCVPQKIYGININF